MNNARARDLKKDKTFTVTAVTGPSLLERPRNIRAEVDNTLLRLTNLFQALSLYEQKALGKALTPQGYHQRSLNAHVGEPLLMTVLRVQDAEVVVENLSKEVEGVAATAAAAAVAAGVAVVVVVAAAIGAVMGAPVELLQLSFATAFVQSSRRRSRN